MLYLFIFLINLKCHIICVHHLQCSNTPTEMAHRGPAKPIAIIIIIAVIIIFITVSRVSYYPPPCFLIAKSKVLLPAIQVGHGAKMSYRHEASILHLAIRIVHSVCLEGGGSAGRIRR